jgi:hypothetical protein
MTTATTSIEVPLPEGAQPTAKDVEVLTSLFMAVASLRLPGGEWEKIRNRLEAAGWDVRWSLQWHVEARRGRELEQVCGRTMDQAFAELWQFTGQEVPVEGTP